MERKLWNVTQKLTPLLSLACLLGTLAAPAFAGDDRPQPPGDEDLAGVLSVSRGVLSVLPEDRDGVLAALGAKPAAEGMWTVPIPGFKGTGGGGTITATLEVVEHFEPLRPPSPGDPVPCNCANIVIYKNSVCAPPWIGIAGGGCSNDGMGGSVNVQYFNPKQCRKQTGGGYCVHVQGTSILTTYYNLENCDPSSWVSTVPTYSLTCGQ